MTVLLYVIGIRVGIVYVIVVTWVLVCMLDSLKTY